MTTCALPIRGLAADVRHRASFGTAYATGLARAGKFLSAVAASQQVGRFPFTSCLLALRAAIHAWSPAVFRFSCKQFPAFYTCAFLYYTHYCLAVFSMRILLSAVFRQVPRGLTLAHPLSCFWKSQLRCNQTHSASAWVWFGTYTIFTTDSQTSYFKLTANKNLPYHFPSRPRSFPRTAPCCREAQNQSSPGYLRGNGGRYPSGRICCSR